MVFRRRHNDVQVLRNLKVFFKQWSTTRKRFGLVYSLPTFFFYFVTFVNLSSPRVIKQLLNRRHAYWNLGRGMRDRLASDPVSVESYKGAPLRLASTFDNAPLSIRHVIIWKVGNVAWLGVVSQGGGCRWTGKSVTPTRVRVLTP